MKYFFIFFFFTLSTVFGQNISEINKVLEISDTLTFEKEIRIYKDYSTTNGMQIFRMYDEGNNNWIVIKYSYSKDFKSITKIEEGHFPKENLGKLKTKNANLIWLNLLLCDVEYLPSQKNIDYKLKNSKIISEGEEYGISKNKKHSLDGKSYNVLIKNGVKKNDFSFENPAFYLKYYPTVDELIAYNELLSVLKKELNLWED